MDYNLDALVEFFGNRYSAAEIEDAINSIDREEVGRRVQQFLDSVEIREATQEDTFKGLTLDQAKEVWVRNGAAFWDGVSNIGLIVFPNGNIRTFQFTGNIDDYVQDEINKIRDDVSVKYELDYILEYLEGGS